MRTVGVKDLKARLSACLREVERGEVFLVTDRGRVVAALGAKDLVLREGGPVPSVDGTSARLVARGARPPLRFRSPGDERPPYRPSGLTADAVDALLRASRDETP
jgi:prevent-host-death family protein